MKTGKNMQELATEIKRQSDTKRDYLASTTRLEMFTNDVHIPEIMIDGHDSFSIRATAHEHIATQTGIPKKYYDKLLMEAPELLAPNVNHWFNKNPESRMVRTLDGTMRAMLSPRYRSLDNFDLFVATAAEAINLMNDGLTLKSSEITERRLYMKFVYPKLSADVKVGDTVQSGVIVSNSEIGYGRVVVQPFLYRLICKNGMIVADGSLKRTHVGRALTELEEAYEIFTDETKMLEDKAFFAKVKDTFRAALSGDTFFHAVGNLKDATTRQITGNVEGAVQVLANRYTFTDDERSSVMNHLFRESDLTQYGLAQAVTRTAEDLSSYDRATEFEKIGGEVIMLPANDWLAIAEAGKPAEKARRGRKAKAA